MLIGLCTHFRIFSQDLFFGGVCRQKALPFRDVLVACHLSALTRTWTDVEPARLSDVHKKLMYTIDPPGPSSEARRIARQSTIRASRLPTPVYSYSPLCGTFLSLHAHYKNPLYYIKYKTPYSPMEHLRRKPEDNEQDVERKIELCSSSATASVPSTFLY